MTAYHVHLREAQIPNIGKELSRSVGSDSSLENVGIHTIVVPKFKLIDVARKIFARDFMEGSYNAALDDTPKSFDGIGMNCAKGIFIHAVTDEAVKGAGRRAFVAVPVMLFASVFVHVLIVAARAFDAIRPAVYLKVGTAGRFIREHLFKIHNRHLVDLHAVLAGLGHGAPLTARPV